MLLLRLVLVLVLVHVLVLMLLLLLVLLQVGLLLEHPEAQNWRDILLQVGGNPTMHFLDSTLQSLLPCSHHSLQPTQQDQTEALPPLGQAPVVVAKEKEREPAEVWITFLISCLHLYFWV